MQNVTYSLHNKTDGSFKREHIYEMCSQRSNQKSSIDTIQFQKLIYILARQTVRACIVALIMVLSRAGSLGQQKAQDHGQ